MFGENNQGGGYFDMSAGRGTPTFFGTRLYNGAFGPYGYGFQGNPDANVVNPPPSAGAGTMSHLPPPEANPFFPTLWKLLTMPSGPSAPAPEQFQSNMSPLGVRSVPLSDSPRIRQEVPLMGVRW